MIIIQELIDIVPLEEPTASDKLSIERKEAIFNVC